jgi:hypothetical protein
LGIASPQQLFGPLLGGLYAAQRFYQERQIRPTSATLGLIRLLRATDWARKFIFD